MNRILLFILAVLNLAGFTSCTYNTSLEPTITLIEGNAQGSTYHITISENKGFSAEELKYYIDSIFLKIDLSLSIYHENSLVSRLNNNESNVKLDPYFKTVFLKSQEISALTDGYFDITIGPLVSLWGFGFKTDEIPDSTMIQSIMENVDYNKVKLKNESLFKEIPSIRLDFNAIAQGYSVDLLSDFLLERGFQNFIVEIGGELIAKGFKNDTIPWKLGIDKPIDSDAESRELKAVIQLKNKALATSGNYRKYRIVNGKKYAHSIDPKTGFPVQHQLISASVVANDCMSADAYATAFMVMGEEKAKAFLEENKDLNLDVYFVSEGPDGSWKTFASDGMKKMIKELN